ncbi:DUF2207 domain-containing protein, partial [Candidatus Saccharibacteria bacterium]|nr:DUF2207 domain-containing protein [Candidatus Saccharibacteria bacterium]
MYKKILVFVLIISISLLTTIKVHAQNVNNFTIDSFEADYYLTKDVKDVAQLKVVEKIVAVFPDFNQNRGIERAIPRDYKNNNLNLKIQNVSSLSGEDIPFTTYKSNDNTVVRIGDKNKYVHGMQTYVITYTMRDVISLEEGHDEWYWDVNGDQWRQNFGTVTARLHIPENLANKLSTSLDPKCFTGTYGGTASDCSITDVAESGGRLITVMSKRGLYPNETLTFVVGFHQGTFQAYKMDPTLLILYIALAMIVFWGPIILVSVFMYIKWRQIGKDADGRGVIVPQYCAEESMNPMLAEVILQERMSIKSISATIIHLCVSGYLKIYEIKKDKLIGSKKEYEVEIIKAPEGLSGETRKVVAMIFSNKITPGSRTNLSDMKNKLYQEVSSLNKVVYDQVTHRGYFVSNPESARNKYVVWSILLLVVGFGIAFIATPYTLPLLGLAFAGMIIIIFRNTLPSRTPKGVSSKEHLLGLEQYMKLAEADRIKYLQAPDTAERSPIDPTNPAQLVKLYEKLLPYAMLFGIEKEWVKQFASLYPEAQSP